MTHEDYRLTGRFPALDGLRAIAASMVVMFHYGGPRLRFVQGWIGVHVFFVLSGFLITTLALREVDRRGRLDLSAFYLRRFFRIVPVYLVVLVLLVLQAELNHVGQARMRAALPYYLTFFNELAPSAAYIQSWTLGIEQKFYLVWPVLAFVLVRRARGRLAVTLTMIMLLVVLIPVPRLSAVHYVVLLLGALLAVVMHHPRGFAVVRPLLSPAGAVVVAVLFVAGHLQLTGLLRRFGELRVIPVYGLAVCFLVVAVVGAGPVRGLLSLRPLAFVGERSYSLYLVQATAHTAVLGLFPPIGARPSVQAALVTWVVGVAIADLLYRWVELPMIRLGKQVAGRRRRTSGPSVVVPPGADAEPALRADRLPGAGAPAEV